MSSSVRSAVFVAFALWVGKGVASPLPVLNPSFEGPSCGPVGGIGVTCTPENWAVTGVYAGAFFPPADAWSSIPDGLQVGFSNGGSLTQALDAYIAPGTIYTLSVWVSQRWTAGSFQPEIQLLGGSTALFTMNLSNPGGAIPTRDEKLNWTWENWTMSWTAPTEGPIIGQQLSISLGGDGIQTDFDNVSLDAAAPEPGMFGLVVAGLFGLVIRRRFVN